MTFPVQQYTYKPISRVVEKSMLSRFRCTSNRGKRYFRMYLKRTDVIVKMLYLTSFVSIVNLKHCINRYPSSKFRGSGTQGNK